MDNPRKEFTVRQSFLRRLVEAIVGTIALVAGVVLQSYGAKDDNPLHTELLILGGVMVAVGGVALSWIASAIISERQAADAVQVARDDVDHKLDNLSRVLGQAAGQISQAVQQSESGQISPATGFALVSQSTRIIYGQVNEISVIRGAKFDSAQLLETAGALDELARQFSGGATDEREVDELRRRLKDIQTSLKTGKPGPIDVDKAVPTSTPRWSFLCPRCGRPMGVRRDGNGARVMACIACLAAIKVDPDLGVAEQDGMFTKVEAASFSKNGNRPKFHCPACGVQVRALLITPDGYTGFCIDDRVVMTLSYEQFNSYLNEPA